VGLLDGEEETDMRGIGLVALALAFSVGCADKAKPKYDECEALENQRRLEDAVDACKAAVAASATSRAGKAAAERLAYLAPKLDAAQKAVQAAKATAAKDPQGQPSGKEREACDHLALLFPESKVGQEAAALLETWKLARKRATSRGVGGSGSPAPPEAPGKPAADILNEQPDLPVNPLRGVAGVFEDTLWEIAEGKCSALPWKASRDEFEDREFRAERVKTCQTHLDRARSLLQRCPSFTWFKVLLNDYDFEKQRFVLTYSGKVDDYYLVRDGRVVLASSVLAYWTGAYPDPSTLKDPFLCQGAESGWDRGLKKIHLDLPMPADAAREIRVTIDKYDKHFVEVVFILDGGTEQASIGCGAFTTKPRPTGRVLAWRLGGWDAKSDRHPISQWVNVSNFDPPDSCEDAWTYLEPDVKREPRPKPANP